METSSGRETGSKSNDESLGIQMSLPVKDSEELSQGKRWYVVGLLCAAMMISYFDRVQLSIAIASPQFTTFFHLNDFRKGALNAAFFWSYAALQIPAGWITDRYGVKYPYAIGFALWTMVSIAAALAGSFWELFAMRVLLGVAESIGTPAGLRWIRFHCSENQRGLAVGLYMAAAKLGPALGPYLAAVLLARYGWRPMFVILAGACSIWLIPWLATVKDDDRKIERDLVSQGQPPIPFSRILKTPLIWGIVLGTFCYQYFVYFCMTWMPAYFAETRGLSLEHSGLYTMFSFSAMAGIAILAGWAGDTLVGRGANPIKVRKAFIIAGFLVASTELFGVSARSNGAALFWAMFSLGGLGLTTANYWALTQTLLPGAAVGRVMGVQNCAASLSGVAASLITGSLKQVTGSYDAPMRTIWLFLLLGIVSYVFVVRPKYAPGWKDQSPETSRQQN
jgi:MFS transporter, ACS family, D-galactonate transporter